MTPSTTTPAAEAAPLSTSPAQAAIAALVSQAIGDTLPPGARALLDVAERLFALHGIEKVSFRELVAASGQRNVSAVTYHFGTREGLLGALLSRRLWLLNKMRLQRLQVLMRLGKANDPHAVVSEIFRVTADAVRLEPWAADFVRVMAQVNFHPELSVKALMPAELNEGMQMALSLIRGALPHLDDATFQFRAEQGQLQGNLAIAMWLHKHGAVTPANEAVFETFVSNTVDYLVGAFSGPMTQAG